MDQGEALLQWGVVVGASLAAVVSDVRTRSIPNALTIPLLVAGLVWTTWQGGIHALVDAVGGTLLLGFPFVILFLFFGGGAGDAKLMGAIGAWLGWKQGIVALFCVAAVGVVLAIAKAIMTKRLKFVLANVFVSVYTFLVFMLSGRRKQYAENEPASLQNPQQSDELTVPYGVAIFAGVCLAAGYVFLW